jgi:hypothetical protein
VVREVVLSFRSASHRSKFPTILRLGPGFGFGFVFVYFVIITSCPLLVDASEAGCRVTK